MAPTLGCAFGFCHPTYRKLLSAYITQFTINAMDESLRTPIHIQTPRFSKIELERMLSLLNEQLQKNGVTGEVCIVGGAAMILAFGSRESTRDIDALVMAPASVRTAVAQVAETNGFSPNWLNDGAKGFASGQSTELKEISRGV
jgi:hypothetical protein